VIAAVLAGLLLLSAGIGIGWGLGRGGNGSSQAAARGPQAPLRLVPQVTPSTGQADKGLNVQAIADEVDPAVVDINTVLASPSAPSFGGGGVKGAGTGMVLTSSGQVLTNNHVVRGAASIRVTIPGRPGSYPADVVGVDPADDVALLTIRGVSGLPSVTLANSSSLRVGQQVVAIGNAFGRGGTPTVTEGIISALDRSITVGDGSGSAEHLSGLIQTDAPISPGDSGGPLVNAAGQVVGMITASERESRTQQASDVGFAIPVNTAIGIVNQIRGGHASSRIILGRPGFLGVEVRNVDVDTVDRLGLSVDSGALVVGVFQGSPAAGAGISQFAVIIAVGGQKIASADALGPAIRTHRPGEQIQVTWVDGNGTHTATVRLIAGPAV
jgi:S1-C subfamily serine protease